MIFTWIDNVLKKLADFTLDWVESLLEQLEKCWGGLPGNAWLSIDRLEGYYEE